VLCAPVFFTSLNAFSQWGYCFHCWRYWFSICDIAGVHRLLRDAARFLLYLPLPRCYTQPGCGGC